MLPSISVEVLAWPVNRMYHSGIDESESASKMEWRYVGVMLIEKAYLLIAECSMLACDVFMTTAFDYLCWRPKKMWASMCNLFCFRIGNESIVT